MVLWCFESFPFEIVRSGELIIFAMKREVKIESYVKKKYSEASTKHTPG